MIPADSWEHICLCYLLAWSVSFFFVLKQEIYKEREKMGVDICNPYKHSSGSWYKGNLHAHTSGGSKCGTMALTDVLAAYHAAGYDFLSISDHLSITEAKTANYTIIPGMEWNSSNLLTMNPLLNSACHTGIYAHSYKRVERGLEFDSLELLLESMPDCLLIANHPNWHVEEHYDVQTLARHAKSFQGMEIFNNLIEADEGQADASWKWDRLLSMGHYLLGFVSDDSHAINDIGKAWIMVKAKEPTVTGLLAAISDGNFYGSTGVMITELGRVGDEVFISLEQQAEIRIIGYGGRLLKQEYTSSLTWNVKHYPTSYIRFHVRDREWQQAWSQPFFIV